MIRQTVSLALIISSVFFLNACGFDKTSAHDDQERRQIQDNDRLKATYLNIAGAYSGSITKDGAHVMDVTILLKLGTKQDGSYSNGQAKNTYTLSASFHRDDIATRDLEMSATYSEIRGDLTLINMNILSSDDISYIDGTLINGTIKGEVRTKQGNSLGLLNLTRDTNVTDPDVPQTSLKDLEGYYLAKAPIIAGGEIMDHCLHLSLVPGNPPSMNGSLFIGKINAETGRVTPSISFVLNYSSNGNISDMQLVDRSAQKAITLALQANPTSLKGTLVTLRSTIPVEFRRVENCELPPMSIE